MRILRYSKDLDSVVEFKDTLTAEEALRVLSRELLGCKYYIADSVSEGQSNALIVMDILRNYKPKRWARE